MKGGKKGISKNDIANLSVKSKKPPIAGDKAK